jgi:hypothetical protein
VYSVVSQIGSSFVRSTVLYSSCRSSGRGGFAGEQDVRGFGAQDEHPFPFDVFVSVSVSVCVSFFVSVCLVCLRVWAGVLPDRNTAAWQSLGWPRGRRLGRLDAHAGSAPAAWLRCGPVQAHSRRAQGCGRPCRAQAPGACVPTRTGQTCPHARKAPTHCRLAARTWSGSLRPTAVAGGVW